MSEDHLNFERPPVSEVALSVQFENLPAFHAAHIGMLWQRFRGQFPKTQEQPPLPPSREVFGIRSVPQMNISISQGPGFPRAWFLSEDETQLIQVQQDRFIHNWRRRPDGPGDEEYPRYATLRKAFGEELATFLNFLQSEKLGELKVTQCELIYVNLISPSSEWKEHRDFDKVLTLWRGPLNIGSGELEDVNLTARYVMRNSEGAPLGRLYVSCTPGFDKTGRPVYQMQLLARGGAISESISGIFEFFDLAHTCALRAFVETTSEALQKHWGRHYAS